MSALLRFCRRRSGRTDLRPDPDDVSHIAPVTPSPALAALPAILAAAVPVLLTAQTGSGETAPGICDAGRISFVFVDNHSVFNIEEVDEDQPFRWAYDLANAVHMRTRRDFIEKELLFGVGDCYDPLRLAESERLLRSYSFIARVDVFGLRQSDGTWHVVVDTTDEWTTELNVRFNFEEGVEFRGVDLTEENVLGRGILLGAFVLERDERQDIGIRASTPRVFGTRLDAELSAGRTRVGNFFRQAVTYPFVGEIGRVAGRQVYERREEQFTFRTGRRGEITDVLLPLEEERIEVTLAGRVGRPGKFTVLGLGLSRETLEFPDFPGGVEIVRNGDFGEAEPAPDSIVARVRDQTLFGSGARFNLLFGQRNVAFVERTGLDALTGIQDVGVGFDAGLTLGLSIGDFSADEERPEDLLTRARFFLGTAPEPFVVNVDIAFEGRNVFKDGRAGNGWRDLIGEVDGLFYWQPEPWSNTTFFARVAAAGGWKMDLPFQLTLGGPSGVRGYHREDFPGSRRLIFSFEDRIYLGWPAPELFDSGLTFFADVGKIWAGDAPFGTDSGWRAAVGGGLRLGFPAGTRGVVRLDLAYPLDGKSLGDAVVRLSLLDLLGLRGHIEDRQLSRTRRGTVGSDVFTVGR